MTSTISLCIRDGSCTGMSIDHEQCWYTERGVGEASRVMKKLFGSH